MTLFDPWVCVLGLGWTTWELQCPPLKEVYKMNYRNIGSKTRKALCGNTLWQTFTKKRMLKGIIMAFAVFHSISNRSSLDMILACACAFAVYGQWGESLCLWHLLRVLLGSSAREGLPARRSTAGARAARKHSPPALIFMSPGNLPCQNPFYWQIGGF